MLIFLLLTYLIEKNWWPSDFNNLTILHQPLLVLQLVCHAENISTNISIHKADDHVFFSTAVFLQYLQTCLLYKSWPNQYKTIYKLR